MKKQICSNLLIILIVGGIAMSVLNFSTKAYARGGDDAIWGTIERVTGALHQATLQRVGRHIWKEYYCVEEPRNCVIVFAN
jgi:ABC-type cobalt transport system substrate-binding protein